MQRPVLRTSSLIATSLVLAFGSSVAWSQTTGTTAPAATPAATTTTSNNGSAVIAVQTPSLTTTAILSGPLFPARPAPIRAEPFFIYPQVGLGLGYTDGVIKADGSRASSATTVLTPVLRGELQTGAHRFTGQYYGQFTRYQGSSEDNTDNHDLSVLARNQFTARLESQTSVYWQRRYQPRVLSFVTGVTSTTPNHYEGKGINFLGGYGARDATGRIEVEASFQELDFLNNRTATAGLDNKNVSLAGRFIYRLSPATRAFVELKHTDYDYKSGNQDNVETTANIGASWAPTPATNVTGRVGRQKKDYANLVDVSNNRWDVTARWTPVTYSNVQLDAGRSLVDAVGLGGATRQQYAKATWNHGWTQRIATQLVASHEKFDFLVSGRTDTVDQLTLKAGYEFRRYLQVGFELSHQNRDSNVAGGSFKRSVFLLTLGASL